MRVMSERIRDKIRDPGGARGDRFRLSHQLGEYVDEHTTILGITPVAHKRKSADELRRDFLKRMKLIEDKI